MILGIETATPVCSVGMAEGDRLLAEINFDIKNLHDRVLAEAIQHLLRWSSTSLSKILAIAVSAGPGSFTGLRIGMSVAKGLAFAQNKPVIAVNTLLLQAAAAASHAQAFARGRGLDYSAVRIVPVIHSRRGEVYTATYTAKASLPELMEAEKVTAASNLVHALSGLSVLCGSGVAALREAGLHENAEHTLALSEYEAPLRGGLVARVGALKYQRGEITNANALEPFYVQAFVTGEKGK